jgi:hypothetical protein
VGFRENIRWRGGADESRIMGYGYRRYTDKERATSAFLLKKTEAFKAMGVHMQESRHNDRESSSSPANKRVFLP